MIHRSSLKAILVLLFLLGLGGAARAAGHVNLIQLDNEIISPVTAKYIVDAIDKSERDGAVCLIIELDTPGGLLESTHEIVKGMLNSKVPIVVYVAPSGSRAGSAGVFITLAAHVAAMAPSTNIGAAHPVLAGGEDGSIKKIIRKLEKETGADKDKKDEKESEETVSPMTEKIVNDTVAWITGIAQTRGRNVDWAKKAVTESVSVPDTEAIKLHIVDFTASDVPDLLNKLMGRDVKLSETKTVKLSTLGAQVVMMPMRWNQRLLAIIVNPNVAYILMMLGMLGLIIEFTHPGAVFPGVAGLICIVLALYAFQTLPVNYAAIGLILLGVLLMIAEIKVVSHGLLALGGIISLLLGSLMLFESPSPVLHVSLLVILPTVATLAVIILFIVYSVLRIQRRPAATGAQGMVGLVGEARGELNPEGTVFVHGENWKATTGRTVRSGEAVRVLRVEGLRLIVEPAAAKQASKDLNDLKDPKDE